MTRDEFLTGVSNGDNHRIPLWAALEATDGAVVEMGMGLGSTPYLHRYCEAAGRELWSYDNNREWAAQYEHLLTPWHRIVHVTDWDVVANIHQLPAPSVVLIDHAPEARRHVDIARFSDLAKVIVIHDSEPSATGYLLARIWDKFQYRVDLKSPVAWATAVSNRLDLSRLDLTPLLAYAPGSYL